MTHRAQFLMLAAAAALLLLGPIRVGDLAGYDDALYAHMARHVRESGQWLRIESNGFPSIEHPPGFVWMQAAAFAVLGPSDFAAKLPSALAGLGTVFLVWWLARRLLDDHSAALLAMFVMLATPYFIKYSAHAMTDVPFTFWTAAAVAAWVAARDDPRSYIAMTLAGAAAMLTRGVVGLVVPVTLLAASVIDRRAWRHVTPALVLMVAPLVGWYAWLIWLHGGYFWEVQREFLAKGIGSGTAGTWRRYTGAPEYLWMLAQSYWPWLPFLAIGLHARWRDRRLAPLSILVLAVFVACSLGGGRVLRYMLPAYPAFSIFAAVGLMRVVPERFWRAGVRWAAPLAAAAALAIALFPPENLHAAEIRPIAAAAAGITDTKERIGFYDQGVARFDETNQIQWYGGRILWILTDQEMFNKALAEPWAKVWIVDRATFHAHFASRSGAQIVAESGHLVCVRLA